MVGELPQTCPLSSLSSTNLPCIFIRVRLLYRHMKPKLTATLAATGIILFAAGMPRSMALDEEQTGGQQLPPKPVFEATGQELAEIIGPANSRTSVRPLPPIYGCKSLFWPAKPGEYLTIPIPHHLKGAHALILAFASNSDNGRVRVYLNQKALPGAIDLFNENLTCWNTYRYPTVMLTGNDNVTLEVLASNPRSRDSLIGLQCVALTSVDPNETDKLYWHKVVYVPTMAVPFAAPPRIPQPVYFPTPLTFRLQIIRAADDNGDNLSDITNAELASLLEELNRAYLPANMRFYCDPATEISTIRSTLLNRDFDIDSKIYVDKSVKPPIRNREAHYDARASLASRYPNKIVCVLQRGSQWRWNETENRWLDTPHGGGGYSDGNVMVAAGRDPGMFSHEIGHYFGLGHTFGAQPNTLQELTTLLQQSIVNWPDVGRPLQKQGDDLIEDTPFDPGPNAMKLLGHKEWVNDEFTMSVPRIGLPVLNLVIKPDYYNIMSYFMEGRVPHPFGNTIVGTFSEHQVRALRRSAELYKRDVTRFWADNTDVQSGLNIECEDMVLSKASSEAVRVVSYELDPGRFRHKHKHFSGGAVLHLEAEENHEVELQFQVPAAGTFHAKLYAAFGLDSSECTVAVDDGKGVPLDLWWHGGIFLPTGALELGTLKLEAGTHTLRIVSGRKHTDSEGCSFDLDFLGLEREGDSVMREKYGYGLLTSSTRKPILVSSVSVSAGVTRQGLDKLTDGYALFAQGRKDYRRLLADERQNDNVFPWEGATGSKSWVIIDLVRDVEIQSLVLCKKASKPGAAKGHSAMVEVLVDGEWKRAGGEPRMVLIPDASGPIVMPVGLKGRRIRVTVDHGSSAPILMSEILVYGAVQ